MPTSAKTVTGLQGGESSEQHFPRASPEVSVEADQLTTVLPRHKSSLLKKPSPSRVRRDSIFLSRIGGAGIRGAFVDQGGLFSYTAPEARVPMNHPLRKIRELVRDVLGELNRSLGKLYASEGRPSIPPEQLLSALLLQVFYGIRSERQLMEQLDYNLLYRWFVGL